MFAFWCSVLGPVGKKQPFSNRFGPVFFRKGFKPVHFFGNRFCSKPVLAFWCSVLAPAGCKQLLSDQFGPGCFRKGLSGGTFLDRPEVLARRKGGAGVLRRRVPPFISFLSEAQRTLRFGNPKFFLKTFICSTVFAAFGLPPWLARGLVFH